MKGGQRGEARGLIADSDLLPVKVLKAGDAPTAKVQTTRKCETVIAPALKAAKANAVVLASADHARKVVPAVLVADSTPKRCSSGWIGTAMAHSARKKLLNG